MHIISGPILKMRIIKNSNLRVPHAPIFWITENTKGGTRRM
jgi:hypothetical protein